MGTIWQLRSPEKLSIIVCQMALNPIQKRTGTLPM